MTVHGGLERIALPAEDVVAVLAEPSPCTLLDMTFSSSFRGG